MSSTNQWLMTGFVSELFTSLLVSWLCFNREPIHLMSCSYISESDIIFKEIRVTFFSKRVKNNYSFPYFPIKAKSNFTGYDRSFLIEKIWFLPVCLLVSLQVSARQFQYPPRQLRDLVWRSCQHRGVNVRPLCGQGKCTRPPFGSTPSLSLIGV